MKNEKVILSAALIIADGTFTSKSLTLEEAKDWVANNSPVNYCGHQTTKILGVAPAETREQCQGYKEALCLSAKGRLDFGKEYTEEEILQIGVNFRLLSNIDSEIKDMIKTINTL